MTDIVNPLLQWLNANPEWAGLATFIISAAESVAIVGTIIPGSITMTAIGTLAGAGVIPLYQTIIWAILGAVLGDSISYWLGYYFKDRLRNSWPFKNNPTVLEKGETFVHRYGVMSVFIGRFVGPVRALVPLVAGMLGMKPVQFTVANVTSAIGWAPAYMLPGILLGAASLELPPDIALHAILTLFLILLFIVLCIWIIYKLLQLINYQTEQFLISMWEKLKKSRRFRVTTVILNHHDAREHHGQLTMAFYFLVTSLLFIALALYVKCVGPQNIFINNVVFHFFRSIRSPLADNTIISLTLLGQKEIILPVLLVFFIWLLFSSRVRTAFHILALGILAAGSVFVIKYLVESVRPWGIFHNAETYSMPSGHATLTATVYMGIAFMIAIPLSPKYRKYIYYPAALLVFAVGVSRLYLGAHWFTDVLAAWLLSAAVLLLVIVSYNRQYEKPLQLRYVSLVCLIAFIFFYGLYYHRHITQLQINYTQIDWPVKKISRSEWWKSDDDIPVFRVSLFGIPSEHINIEWAGNLDDIRSSLLKNGWVKPPARDWISTLHRVTGIQSAAYLPMVSPEYLDKRPELILVKRENDIETSLVIRLWASNRMLMKTNTPLWVGTLGIIPRSYNWIFHKHRNYEMDFTDLFETNQNNKAWQWKMMTIDVPTKSKRKKVTQQTFILIRSQKIS